MKRICFDYGHGGLDPGAVYQGRREKDDVLYIGRRIASEIIRHGVLVDETRTGDMDLSLRERTNFERQGKYEYFISFHRNAFRPEEARGVETFVYLKPTSRAKKLAYGIQNSLVDIGFLNRGVKTANFYVLRNTRSPAILVEIGFLDNSLDNKIYDENREKIIRKISQAILKELGISYRG